MLNSVTEKVARIFPIRDPSEKSRFTENTTKGHLVTIINNVVLKRSRKGIANVNRTKNYKNTSISMPTEQQMKKLTVDIIKKSEVNECTDEKITHRFNNLCGISMTLKMKSIVSRPWIKYFGKELNGSISAKNEAAIKKRNN